MTLPAKMPTLWLGTLLLSLTLFSTASRGQNVSCDPANPARCQALIEKGAVSPLTGVVMTPDMAIALKTTLDACISQVDAQQAYYNERLGIEETACAKKLSVVEATAKERETLIQNALKAEQERSKQLAEETAKTEAAHWLWAAGGVGVGVLVGIGVTTGALVYVTVLNP